MLGRWNAQLANDLVNDDMLHPSKRAVEDNAVEDKGGKKKPSQNIFYVAKNNFFNNCFLSNL